MAPVSEPLPKAGDRWNIYRIVMNGDHLIVELNNERTVDKRDDKPPVALLLFSGPAVRCVFARFKSGNSDKVFNLLRPSRQ